MSRHRLTGPRPGLLTRIVSAIAGIALLAGVFVVGLFAWVLLAGVLLVGAAAVAIAVWRQRRRMEKFSQQQKDSYLEVEYEVVSETTRRRERE